MARRAWRRFLHITLPGLRYVIIVAVLLATIFTFNSFTLTYLLTGGGPGGATRIYTILAYEYAVAGAAVRRGRRGGDDRRADPVPADPVPRPLHDGQAATTSRAESEDGSSGGSPWRSSGRCGCSAGLVLALFWVVNDVVERASARRRRRCGRPARRRCCQPRPRAASATG